MITSNHTLGIQTKSDIDGTRHLILAGDIDEHAQLKPITELESGTLILDLAGVERINSIGVREWINTMKLISDSVDVWWERVSPAMVMQLNMIANFNGRAKMRSIYAPYYCPRCDSEHRFLVQIADLDAEQPVAPKFSCPQCEQNLEFDDIEVDYFGALFDALNS